MSKLLMDDRPLMVLPKLVMQLGSIQRAIVLQQIHWLMNQPKSGMDHDGKRWVWGTYEEWCEDYFPFWKPSTLRKHVTWLEKNSLLESEQLNPDKWNKTKYYTIKYDYLQYTHDREDKADASRTSRIEGEPPSHIEVERTSRMNTESSSETTTETSSLSAAADDNVARREMFAKVADICGLDMTLGGGRIGKTVKNLRKAGYGMEELERFGKEIWLYDWRWSKHRQRPTLAILEEEIGKLRAKPLDIPSVVENRVGFVHDNNRIADRIIENAREARDNLERETAIQFGRENGRVDAIAEGSIQRISGNAGG